MEFFQKAKTITLKSHHDKYLLADDDQESVYQDRCGTINAAKWSVELVEGIVDVVRFKSCFGKYLTASDKEFLLRVTGQQVLQTLPRKLDSSVEWEPIRDGFMVKLKTRYGNYLRANGGLPPWRNSITHDVPYRHSDWILWEVDVVETRTESSDQVLRSDSLSLDLSSSSFHLRSPGAPNLESSDSFVDSPMKTEGRIIYYQVVEDDGNGKDAIEELSINYKGHGLEELAEKLGEETGLENIILCSRNPVTGNLYTLRLDLALPPNNASMHIVVVPSASKAARDLVPSTPS